MRSPKQDLQTIPPEHPDYPAGLKTCTAFKTAPTLTAIGNLSLLQNPAIALFCSIKCPGELILKTYDLTQSLRHNGSLVISGFHTPIEQDCLKILLRGTQYIIHCPARSLQNIRLSPEQNQAIGENRLLLLSPFGASCSRATADLAQKRNEMIGAISHTVFIAHAAPNSKTQAFAQRLVQTGKSVVTFNSPNNLALQQHGIISLDFDALEQSLLLNPPMDLVG
jgi:predicted Rossmann fold nucleotide-binding protein DprA/Smf involved in DNA uptake